MAAIGSPWLAKLVYLSSEDRVKYENLLHTGRAVAEATKSAQDPSNEAGSEKTFGSLNKIEHGSIIGSIVKVLFELYCGSI